MHSEIWSCDGHFVVNVAVIANIQSNSLRVFRECVFRCIFDKSKSFTMYGILLVTPMSVEMCTSLQYVLNVEIIKFD